MLNSLILGIAGGTGSGKTTMVKEISQMLGNSVTVIPADSYYYDRSYMTPEERDKLNYDHPDAIEIDLLCKHIKMLKEGKSIERPIYDFCTHTRAKETVHIEAGEIIIIDGILIFSIPELRNLMDIKIFVDTDADERLMRRIIRDVLERGRTYEGVMKQWRETVAPMHSMYVEASKRFAHMIIPHGYNEIVVGMIVAFLQKVKSEEEKKGDLKNLIGTPSEVFKPDEELLKDVIKK